jgi:hypothetical protein
MAGLSWEANALEQRGKARIRAQTIEGRFDFEQDHLPIARLEPLLKPFERSIRVSKADVHHGDANWGWIGILGAVLLADVPVFAQAPIGTIGGSVMDSSGSVLVDASITVRQEDTGVRRRVATDHNGRYHVANLEPGTYEIDAGRTGFGNALRQVTLRVGDSLTVDFELNVRASSKVDSPGRVTNADGTVTIIRPRTPSTQIINPVTLPDRFANGDTFVTQDVRITKRIRMSNRVELSLIGEVFNLLNIANLTGYRGVLNLPNYGQPSARMGQVFGVGGAACGPTRGKADVLTRSGDLQDTLRSQD